MHPQLGTIQGTKLKLREALEMASSSGTYDPDHHLLSLTCIACDLIGLLADLDLDQTSPLELEELLGSAKLLNEAIFFSEQLERTDLQ